MRCSSLCPFSVVLGLGFALACSSPSRDSEPDTAVESEPQAPATTPATAEEPHAPIVGAPAPALALDSLSGTRVQLPAPAGDGDAKRAAVLIFGSFS